MTIAGGYILLSRKLIESTIMKKPPLYSKVWIWLLLNAYYKPHNGIERGQLVTSIPKIREAMSYMVGYRKEIPSYKQIRAVIEWLRNPYEGEHEGQSKGTMIGTTKVTHGILIKISNYGLYQDPKNYEGHNEGYDEIPTKELRREKRGHNNIYKKEKKEKNIKKDTTIDNVPYEEIKKLYNQLCPSLPPVKVMSDNRKKHAKVRWNENDGNIEIFKKIFQLTEASEFLKGKNDRNWKADFDWLIKNNHNFNKVLEGKYDNDRMVRGSPDKDRSSPDELQVVDLVKNKLNYDIAAAKAREMLKYADNNIDLIKEKILEAREKEMDPAQTYYWLENAVKKTNPLYRGYR